MKNFTSRMIITAAIIAAYTIGLSVGAYAQERMIRPERFIDPRPSTSFMTKVYELAQWLEDNSEFERMKKPPAFIFLSPEEIDYIYYQTGFTNGYQGSDPNEVEAIYGTGTMYLPKGYDINSEPATVLHELVHHLQWEQKKEFYCIGMSEEEAYNLDTKFMKEKGIYNRTPDQEFFIRLTTMCPRH